VQSIRNYYKGVVGLPLASLYREQDRLEEEIARLERLSPKVWGGQVRIRLRRLTLLQTLIDESNV
jgi:hypothetical protein